MQKLVCLMPLALLVARCASGQDLVMTGLEGNGNLAWTYPTNGVAAYGIEWTPELAGGKWTDLECGLQGIQPTGETMAAAVPMFYRVKALGAAANGFDLTASGGSGKVAGHPGSYRSGGAPYTSPTGVFTSNGYGLYDMAGNVWECCWDLYGSTAYADLLPETDPQGLASGDERMLRGGGWWNWSARLCRVAFRGRQPSGEQFNDIGFRCVRRGSPPS